MLQNSIRTTATRMTTKHTKVPNNSTVAYNNNSQFYCIRKISAERCVIYIVLVDLHKGLVAWSDSGTADWAE